MQDCVVEHCTLAIAAAEHALDVNRPVCVTVSGGDVTIGNQWQRGLETLFSLGEMAHAGQYGGVYVL